MGERVGGREISYNCAPRAVPPLLVQDVHCFSLHTIVYSLTIPLTVYILNPLLRASFCCIVSTVTY
jgi:hypothetical protein